MQVCTTWKLCDWPTSFDSLEVLDIEDIVAKPCGEFLHNSSISLVLPAAPLLATPKIPFCLHMRHNDGLSFTGNCKMMLSIYPRINTKQCRAVFMASFAKLLNLYWRRSVAETLVSILRWKSKDTGAVQIPLAILLFKIHE